MKAIGWFIVCWGMCALRVFGQDTAGVGAIAGAVKTGGGAPAVGVKVCLRETTRCARTGANGEFRLSEVRTGQYRLEVEAAGAPALLSEPLEVRAGLEGRVDVSLPTIDAIQQSVTISEPVFLVPEEGAGTGYLIQPREILKAAGALQDVSRYAQMLPGVAAGANDFRTDLVVRGGSPLENLYIVDNVEIPNINSFSNLVSAGGAMSMVDAGLIRDVTFLSGGYSAPFINRASSVMQIAQREGHRDGFEGRAMVGFAGAGGIAEGPLRSGRGSWIVSARRSFLDLFTKDVGVGGTPVTYSFNAKALYDLTPRDRVWAVGIAGVDRMRLGAAEGIADDQEWSNVDIRYQGWRAASGLNWQHTFGARGVGLLGVAHSEASVSSRVRDLVRNGIPPAGTPIEEQLARAVLVYREDSREGESTLKYDLTLSLPAIRKLQAGGSLKIFRVDYDFASPVGDDSPFSATLGGNPLAIRRDFVAGQAGGYAQATRDLTSRLSLTWGGRVDSYRYIGRTRFSPRAGLNYRLTEKLSWRASYGSYYQQPFFIFLSAFPQNRGLVPFHADHYVTGVSFLASDSLRFTVEAYRKTYKDYPVAMSYPALSMAGVGDTFATQEVLFPLASAGRGHAQGIELFVEKKFTGKWYGQANLAFSRTMHAGLDGITRPGAFDSPRVFNALGGYRATPKWEISGRFVHLAGRPYTPFDESLSREQRRGVFDLSRVNALRSAAYVRVDLRMDYTLHIAGRDVLFFGGLQNIFDRRNVAGYSWDRRYNRPRTDLQLGRFPLVGLDWRF